tara:strand:+ start:108 stop:257 length:150 start_codon:yes stop_codon:yes gene_type:complete
MYYGGPTMTWEEYVREELAYYEEHPEESDPLEAHSNGEVALEVEYTCSG